VNTTTLTLHNWLRLSQILRLPTLQTSLSSQ